jgi:hypothetical protein
LWQAAGDIHIGLVEWAPPVKVARSLADVLESGLAYGEVVVTDGHLLLNNGSRVSVR